MVFFQEPLLVGCIKYAIRATRDFPVGVIAVRELALRSVPEPLNHLCVLRRRRFNVKCRICTTSSTTKLIFSLRMLLSSIVAPTCQQASGAFK